LAGANYRFDDRDPKQKDTGARKVILSGNFECKAGIANLADVGRVFVLQVSHSPGAVRQPQIVLPAFLFVGMVVVAGGIPVIITGTNLSGVTGIAVGDTAATLDPNR
jgi:hypothetical protein